MPRKTRLDSLLFAEDSTKRCQEEYQRDYGIAMAKDDVVVHAIAAWNVAGVLLRLGDAVEWCETQRELSAGFPTGVLDQTVAIGTQQVPVMDVLPFLQPLSMMAESASAHIAWLDPAIPELRRHVIGSHKGRSTMVRERAFTLTLWWSWGRTSREALKPRELAIVIHGLGLDKDKAGLRGRWEARLQKARKVDIETSPEAVFIRWLRSRDAGPAPP
jgi:hypothetical protein